MECYRFFCTLKVSILCFLCLISIGNIAEGTGEKVQIELPHLSSELPSTWRPKANTSLAFKIQITKPANYSGGKLTATLSNVTTYIGSCGNRDSSYPDLLLPCDTVHTIGAKNVGWTVESHQVSLSERILLNNTNAEVTTFTSIYVDCEDYAAYGILTLTATGSTGNATPIVVEIPQDDNGNKIADGWRNDHDLANPGNSKDYVATDDNERGPPLPNSELGDNFTVLDEYRGLYTNGTWTDTNPESWDIFITCNVMQTDGQTSIGYASAGAIPGTETLHLMASTEVDFDRGRVCNYQASHLRVYALRLLQDGSADGEGPLSDMPGLGGVLGAIGDGPPHIPTKGYIFVTRTDAYWDFWNGSNQPLDKTKDDWRSSVVTHELGHGVSLPHCPNKNEMDCYMWAIVDRASGHETQYHTHHIRDYDLKDDVSPWVPQEPFDPPVFETQETRVVTENGWELQPMSNFAPDDDRQNEGNRGGDDRTTTEQVINPGGGTIPTTTSTSYGCNNVVEHDWCSDDGTCTTRSDASSDGPCGHRWCLCANYNGSETSGDTSNNGGDTSEDTSSNTIISTNTGLSSNGCDYNAEHDYCSDTGSCTTTSDPYSNGSCGHRHCLCANHNDSIISTNTGPSENGCDYNAERDYCTDAGSCATTSDPSSNGPCGHRYCLCAQ